MESESIGGRTFDSAAILVSFVDRVGMYRYKEVAGGLVGYLGPLLKSLEIVAVACVYYFYIFMMLLYELAQLKGHTEIYRFLVGLVADGSIVMASVACIDNQDKILCLRTGILTCQSHKNK